MITRGSKISGAMESDVLYVFASSMKTISNFGNNLSKRTMEQVKISDEYETKYLHCSTYFFKLMILSCGHTRILAADNRCWYVRIGGNAFSPCSGSIARNRVKLL